MPDYIYGLRHAQAQDVDALREAGGAIRALVCGYPASVRKRKIMAVLQGSVDDSASDTGDRRFFLAGYINTAPKWEEFADEWARVLRAPPAIDYCKMAEAQNLRGQFLGWSEQKRDAKVNALAAIVRDHSPWSVHTSVSRKEYDAIVAPVAPFPLRHPYTVCFLGILSAASRGQHALGMEPPLPVDFVFDEQNGLEDVAVTTYRWLRDNKEPEIRDLLGATPIFRDDKRVLPLQAADMLAWHIRRSHECWGQENRLAAKLLLGNHTFIDCKAALLKHLGWLL